MKIYLAGPDVFLPDAVEIGRRKAEICGAHGLSGLYPLDNAVDLKASDASLTIFKANQAMMDEACAIIANLTPFRGPSADAGTVYELGYMAGRGKLCLPYTNDPPSHPPRPCRYLARSRRVRDLRPPRGRSRRWQIGLTLTKKSDHEPASRKRVDVLLVERGLRSEER